MSDDQEVDIKEYKRKRGTIKGKLTNFTNYVNSLKEALSLTQKAELTLRLSKIEDILNQFDEVQTIIEIEVDENEITKQYAERQEFENQYFSIVAIAQQLCCGNKPPRATRHKQENDGSSSSDESVKSTVKCTRAKSHGIKLPTIQVPKFSGQYEDWLEFRDTFSSLIHNNESINSIQKFHYLRSALEGTAARVIHSLEFSSDNYNVAWDLLCERFNNKRVLLQKHVKSLYNLEQIKKESAQSIRSLIDTYTKDLRCLQTLGEPTQYWDTPIIYLVNSKLDPKTSREWEERKNNLQTVTLEALTSFLRDRADLLETINTASTSTYTQGTHKQNVNQVRGLASVTNSEQTFSCPVCNGNHRVYGCETFQGQSTTEKLETVRKLRLCMNCLRKGHIARHCRLGPCTKCSQLHNTLLHDDSSTAKITTLSVEVMEPVLLSTAVVYICDKDNVRHKVRAVLDSGSQASFMTEGLMQKLKLKYTQTHASVVGINNSVSQITKRCNASVESRVSSYTVNMSFLVLPNIANFSQNTIHIQKLTLPTHLKLADPEYYDASKVDLLLGADIFWELLDQGQIRLGPNSPVLQQTKLGYIISGPTSGLGLNSNQSNNVINCNFIQNEYQDVQNQLTKFWSIEEIQNENKPFLSTEEQLCEDTFINNHTRTLDGRFEVAIPLKRPETCLGDSFERAKHCFLSLERRLLRQPKLRQMYTDFMTEYKTLGHMSLVSERNDGGKQSYYLPHHGVLRESSETTKLRVVFNASAPSTNGVSFNDLQAVGPTIQSDLFDILIRFRHYSFVLTGDVEKMYRQVLVTESQRHLQKIIWRDNPNQELQIYKLNTVTYGTASAPFLAIRCIKQIAIECEDETISDVIKNDFYVDDLVTGSQTIDGLIQIRDGVYNALSKGCFNLRKLKSNVSNFAQNQSDSTINFNNSNTLGLGWSPSEDNLYFSQKPALTQTYTKRSILSSIGQIFDPLGLLCVFVIRAKILLQKLWLLKVSWDDELPQKIIDMWLAFTSDLHHLNTLRIPRAVICQNSIRIELHTFCDASQDAYGACLYVRTVTSDNRIQSRLLCAKSRVSPLKPVTIPRLELLGALIAARLTNKVIKAFKLQIHCCTFWTDSSIVLCWLRTEPYKLKQFVKNRVAEIQELTANHLWKHISTDKNPADLITRGVRMSELQKIDFWWFGPKFLSEPESEWPKSNFNNENENLPDTIITMGAAVSQSTFCLINMENFSSLLKLKRVMAYTLRFINNCKIHDHEKRNTGPLNVNELNTAFIHLLRQSQSHSFLEYETLKNKQTLHSKNSLLKLSPFMDGDNLIRVGGRLENTNFEYDKKHPILLTSKHHLTKLIFFDEHQKLFHAGPQLLLSSIRERFWPLGGRNLAKLVSHRCHKCFRLRAQTAKPVMGQLPEQRFQVGYPFQITGVDYAGPLIAADRKGRGCKLIKVYVAVFVCFSVKAVHLELVSDLTKEAYIAALRRFIARRSKPSCIYSDNGTQFIGAKNEILNFIKCNSSDITESMANEGIDFKFIPAYAPHFGGLWEAGVKAFKYHLVRVLGNSHLTFEELYTTLTQIESILNSRPLVPISSDPQDLCALTPGHFLVGRPLTAIPTPRFDDANSGRLRRWERVEQLRQHFWTRWHKEYVSELQQKTKWRCTKGHINEGTMVIVKEDSLPPMKWLLGRIKRTFPGTDGVTRVAEILTQKGTIRRAFNKICPLPSEDDHGSDSVESNSFNPGEHVKD